MLGVVSVVRDPLKSQFELDIARIQVTASGGVEEHNEMNHNPTTTTRNFASKIKEAKEEEDETMKGLS